MEPPHGGEEERKDCSSRVRVETLRQKPCDVPVGGSPVGGGSLLWKYLLLMNKMQDIFHFVGSASDLADSQKDAVESDRSWEMTRGGEELQLKIKRIIKIIMNNENRQRAVTGWFLVCRLLSY